MSRVSRKVSESGIYHVILRGINRQNIFEDDYDYDYFLELLKKYKEKSGFSLYAYCLMPNHLHLLLKVENEPLDLIMKRILGSFVFWYNKKYDRIGSLFQDRYKSEPVEDDSYFLTVVRYIHQNPLKARLEKNLNKFPWSSYNAYRKPADDVLNIVDTNYLLGFFDDNPVQAIKLFKNFHSISEEELVIDIDNQIAINDKTASRLIVSEFDLTSPKELQNFEIGKRNSILRKLKNVHGLSLRQIERLTGINRGTIHRA